MRISWYYQTTLKQYDNWSQNFNRIENSVNNANQFYFAMYTKSRNMEIMKGDETDEIIEELFKSLLKVIKNV